MKRMKAVLTLLMLLVLGTGGAFAASELLNYQPGYRTIDGSKLNLMVAKVNRLQGFGSAPVLTACGTSPAILGSRTAGLVTMGTGTPTGCVITFPANSYTAAPYCVVTWQTNIASMQYTVTSTAITLVQTATDSNKVNYYCLAQ